MSDERQTELFDGLDDALQSYVVPPPPRGNVDRIALRIDAERRRRRRRRWSLVALVASLLLAVVYFAVGRGTIDGELDTEEPMMITLGERASVFAGAGASLSYHVSANGECVVDQRQGEARYLVERGGLFRVRTPAGVVSVRGTEFVVSVEEGSMTRQGKIAIGGAGSVIVVVSVIAGSVLFENEHGQVALAAGQVARATPSSSPALEVQPSAAEDEPPAQREPRRSGSKRLQSAEARRRLVQAIEHARERRVERERREEQERAASGGGVAPETPPRGRLSREYIQDAVRDTVPLIRECYEMALEENETLNGQLRARFTIAGEEDVGGYVESAEVEADDELANEDFLECVRETVMSIEFEPPEGGGVVEVTYPFNFASTAQPEQEEEAMDDEE